MRAQWQVSAGLLLCPDLAASPGLVNTDLAWLLRVPYTENRVWNTTCFCIDVMHVHNIACLAYAGGQTWPCGVAEHGHAGVSLGCGRRLAAFKQKYSRLDALMR